jgi:CubicO group peptidase (beta-lactamase class C family)
MLLVLFSPVRAAGQNRLTRIDSLVSRRAVDYELSGNILLAEKGNVVYERSIGLANTLTGKSNDQHSSFQLASVSKLFTSVAILQLKDKHRLKLDDPVGTYIPELNNKLITIRHLLTHTSGLADYQILEKPYAQDTSKVFEINDIPSAINNDPNAFRFAPGERWSYSNSGYNLLALIVERVSKLRFQDYLKQNIFIPANMLHTYISTPLLKVSEPDKTVGYDYLNFAPWLLPRADSLPQNHIELLHLDGLLGQSNVFSTTNDLLNFDTALYQGRLLTRTSLDEAFRPTRLTTGELASTGWKNTSAYQGLGWHVLKDTTLGKVVFHSGGQAGAVTMFIRNVTTHQTVIVLNNVTHRSTHNTAMSLLYLLNGGSAQTDKRSIANEFSRTLIKSGLDEALTSYHAIKTDTARFYLDEREMNRAGLGMFYNGFKKQGIELLRLNTVLFAASSNVYDSYAMVLTDLGKRQEAIKMYKKTVELNPKADRAKKALVDLGIR